MNRSLDARLRGLEVKETDPPLHIIWSDRSDRAEWEHKNADLIARGQANEQDEFLLVGWRCPERPQTG